MLTVVPGDGSGHEGGKDRAPSLIDEIVREGARRMLAEALQAEVDAYIAAFAAGRDENGRRIRLGKLLPCRLRRPRLGHSRQQGHSL
jgi:hypothetical protein